MNRDRVSWAQEVFKITGSVETADESMPADCSIFTAALESCQQFNLRHEVLTGDEANERWPGYRLPSSFKVSTFTPQWSGVDLILYTRCKSRARLGVNSTQLSHHRHRLCMALEAACSLEATSDALICSLGPACLLSSWTIITLLPASSQCSASWSERHAPLAERGDVSARSYWNNPKPCWSRIIP